MRDRTKAWRLYSQSKTFACRPSDLLGITNTYVAYCLDEAIYIWGTSVENAIEEAGEDAKTTEQAKREKNQTFDRWMGQSESAVSRSTKKFANPVATKTK